MRVLVISSVEQEKEIKQKNVNHGVEIIFSRELAAEADYKSYDVLFILNLTTDFVDFSNFQEQAVYINSVTDTLSALHLPANIGRINGWPGFLQREEWEIACQNEDETKKIFHNIGWKIKLVKDEPGFVAPRVLSMIINEAFFALDEKVSTKEEIDLAMKLGTNYPYGPFEWAEMIGIKNIVNLLNKLAEKDTRYLPSAGLIENQSEQK